MSKHIDPTDVISAEPRAEGESGPFYSVKLWDIDGNAVATLASFDHASAAAIYCANLRNIVKDWLEAAEECGRDNFVAYLSERKS